MSVKLTSESTGGVARPVRRAVIVASGKAEPKAEPERSARTRWSNAAILDDHAFCCMLHEHR